MEIWFLWLLINFLQAELEVQFYDCLLTFYMLIWGYYFYDCLLLLTLTCWIDSKKFKIFLWILYHHLQPKRMLNLSRYCNRFSSLMGATSLRLQSKLCCLFFAVIFFHIHRKEHDVLAAFTGTTLLVPYLWKSCHCNLFKVQVPVDFTHGYPIFKWVAVPWQGWESWDVNRGLSIIQGLIST